MRPTSRNEQRWIAQWRGAGSALAQQWRRELAALTDEQAITAADALLSLVEPGCVDPRRLADSGLVRQQALLHRGR